MSNAKEKARELVNKYVKFTNYWDYYNDCSRDTFIVIKEAKECALIVVDEVLFALKYDFNDPTSGSIKYWQEVKQEICNL